MDDMNMEVILSALKSPLSDLNLYRDDLSKDYLLSDAFVKEIAYQIMESVMFERRLWILFFVILSIIIKF